MKKILHSASAILDAGGIIAYPTEAMYGLGALALNEAGVLRILALKSRPIEKGLILISDCFDKLKPYIDFTAVSESQLERVLASWPGPYTWVFPASDQVPYWIKGDFNSVALRITKHPVAAALCAFLKQPLVSTSANRAGTLPARSVEDILEQFPEGVDLIVPGEVNHQSAPSTIRLLNGDLVRG